MTFELLADGVVRQRHGIDAVYEAQSHIMVSFVIRAQPSRRGGFGRIMVNMVSGEIVA